MVVVYVGMAVFICGDIAKVDEFALGFRFRGGDSIVFKFMRMYQYMPAAAWSVANRRMFPDTSFQELPKWVRRKLVWGFWIFLTGLSFMVIAIVMNLFSDQKLDGSLSKRDSQMGRHPLAQAPSVV